MSRKVAKRALLGFAAGALQGAQQFLQTRAAQEAERLREERLTAIRSEERRQDQAIRQAERREDHALTETRDNKQRTFQIELMGQQAKLQGARDEQQAGQRMKEIAAQGANSVAYAQAAQQELAPVRFLIVNKDGTEQLVEGNNIPAGARAKAAFSASGQPVRLGGETADGTPAAAATSATNPASSIKPLPRSGISIIEESEIPAGSQMHEYKPSWDR